jgi:hypothetical protein
LRGQFCRAAAVLFRCVPCRKIVLLMRDQLCSCRPTTLLTLMLEKSWHPVGTFKQLSGKMEHASLWLHWQPLALSLNLP